MLILLLACTNKIDEKVKDSDTEVLRDTLSNILKDSVKEKRSYDVKNDRLKLPLNYSICDDEVGIKTGIVFSNEKFYVLIDRLVGDCQIPYLKTYMVDGSLIDSFAVTTGNCANDCGYYCSETFMIDTELKFISRDTITEYKCDSIGEDRSKMTKSVCYLTGQIDLNGIIRISKLITEKLK